MRLLPASWLFAVSALFAQAPGGFRFDDFTSVTTLRLVAQARFAGGALRLTPARNDTRGAAWFPGKQTIGGGFETEFQFLLTDQGGLGRGADGFAFVVQNSGPEAIAGRGSSGGFALGDGQGDKDKPGIAHSVAIFFDTFKNQDGGDPSDNYIAICTNGKVGEMQWPPARLAMAKKPGVKLKDGNPHHVRIVYTPPVMRLFLNHAATPLMTSTVDFGMVADANAAVWVGFTASTGGGWENHDILSWSFSSGPKPDVGSNMSIVSSNIAFLAAACLPDRNLCTPERAIIEPKSPGEYHVVLPANLEWGASIPNSGSRRVAISNARGTVCWAVQSLGQAGCSGPAGTVPAGEPFADPKAPAGALTIQTRGGRTFFSVNDRKGEDFQDNEGYFEFDVVVR